MGISYGEWKFFGNNIVNILWINGPNVGYVL